MAETNWYPAILPDGTPEQGVVGRFEYYDQLDIAASKLADQKIFKKIIVLRTKATSSVDESVQPVRPHNQHDFTKRFPTAWAAFQGEAVPVQGTPLAELTEISEAQTNHLRLYGISVIEQIAVLSDAGVESLGFGFRTLRSQAQAFLAAREKIVQDKIRALVTPSSVPPVATPTAAVAKKPDGRTKAGRAEKRKATANGAHLPA